MEGDYQLLRILKRRPFLAMVNLIPQLREGETEYAAVPCAVHHLLRPLDVSRRWLIKWFVDTHSSSKEKFEQSVK